MKKLIIASLLSCAFGVMIIAQGSGTPSTLRVLVDSTGALLASSTAFVGQSTSCLFSNCRLRTDSLGNLVVTDGSGAGFAPANATYITQTPNAGLSAEQALSSLASGILTVTTGTGVVASTLSPAGTSFFAATQTDCTAVGHSFTGRVTTGLNSHAANTWNLCGGGTLGLSGNTTEVTSSLPLLGTLATFSSTIRAQNGGSAGNLTAIFGADDGASTLTNNTNKTARIGLAGYANATPVIFAFTSQTLATNDIFFGGGTSLGYAATTLGFYTAPNGTSTTGTLKWSIGSNGNLTPSTGISYNLVSSFATRTAPSTPVACTSPTVTWSNGSAVMQFDVGTSCTGVTTLAFTMPAVTNGWQCNAHSVTAPATSVPSQSAGTTTSVTLTNYSRTTGLAQDWTDAADIRVSCFGG